jgi:hypothetical protein
MLRFLVWLTFGVVCGRGFAAEHVFDFNRLPLNTAPPGFRSTVTGEGGPGEWKIVLDEVPSGLEARTSFAPKTQRPVLAQLSRDTTDERFPLLIFEEKTFGDFTLRTRFKTVSGEVAQMAGIAFRIQDEKNYYYVRASSSGNTFRFFKVVDGLRSQPIGPDLEIPSGVWHELTLECKGNRIDCRLNGKEVFPTLIDNSFQAGKIGFWTKSDAVSYFADTRIHYIPQESLAQLLVRESLARFPRVAELTIFTHTDNPARPEIVASSKPEFLGNPGSDIERTVIRDGSVFFGKNTRNRTVVVTLPLRNRNGDSIAAVRVVLDSFRGQTEQNAIARAMPILKLMESRTRSVRTIVD